VPVEGNCAPPGWDARKDLSLELSPGKAVDVSFNAEAPPDHYMLEVSLVQELVFWFHDEGMRVPGMLVVI
jgi:hypothetical protein